MIETDAKTSRRLGRIPQRDTSIEREVRKQLHALGLRFRISNRDIAGSPDIANRRRKWAIFVHGCYWHHHDGCRRATIPKRNKDFWETKFKENRARDARAITELENSGFQCLVIWECEVKDNPSEARDKLSNFATQVVAASDC